MPPLGLWTRRRAGRPAGLLVPAIAVALILGLIPAASAHEYWLSPSTYRAGRGEEVAVSALNGEGFGGERRSYARERTRALELHGQRALDLTLAAAEGDSILARFVAPDDSGAVVVFVSNPTRIELPADKFESYLVEEGLEGVRNLRARAGRSHEPGRERFRRCAKTWIMGPARSGGAHEPAARLLRPVGLPAEIVPVTDPLASEIFQVRVLFRGEPVAGALLHIWRRPLARGNAPRHLPRELVPAVGQARTDRYGEAALVLHGGGEFLVSAVHMVPSSDTGADWESYWASLTFARP